MARRPRPARHGVDAGTASQPLRLAAFARFERVDFVFLWIWAFSCLAWRVCRATGAAGAVAVSAAAGLTGAAGVSAGAGVAGVACANAPVENAAAAIAARSLFIWFPFDFEREPIAHALPTRDPHGRLTAQAHPVLLLAGTIAL